MSNPTYKEEAFNKAALTIANKGIRFTINPLSCCRGCVSHALLGIQEGDDYAFALFSNVEGIDTEHSEIEWIDDELTIGSYVTSMNCGWRCDLNDNENEDRHAYDEKCVYGSEQPWETRVWKTLNFNYPNAEVGQTIVSAFTEQGFDVEWDGDTDKSVIVTV